jgi:hypothetical protein
MALMRAFLYTVIYGGLLLLATVAILVWPENIRRARAADTCDGFISASCCCTSGACFVIPRSEIIRLDETRYRITRTGEVIEAKGSSPDGQVRRCTHGMVGNEYRIGHPDAKTSCLYVTETGS